MFVQVVDFKASGFVTLPVAAAVAVAYCTFQLLVLLVLFLPAVSVFPDILISCFYHTAAVLLTIKLLRPQLLLLIMLLLLLLLLLMLLQQKNTKLL